MHVLLAASELHPYSKTGGLADAVGSLGRALALAGVRVTVVTPLYRGLAERVGPGVGSPWRFDIGVGKELVPGEFVRVTEPSGMEVWFVRHDAYFDRPGLYNEGQNDYADNAARFLFLARAALLAARHAAVPVDVVHAHDWQVGLLPLMVHHARITGAWPRAPRTLFTIHNLAYQGGFAADAWTLTGLPWSWFHLESAAHGGGVNFLKAGLCLADALSTVSPRYAREICTPEFGCGLDGVLRRREHDLCGILNGVDYDEWNTTRNPALPHPYHADDLSGKAMCKAALQGEMGLAVDPGVPLFGNISRLTDQKGCDLLAAALEGLLPREPLQFVLLGSGDPALEATFRSLATRFPGRVAARIGFNPALAHRIEAASDFYVMPSRFEPCGLNQLYSLRYGAIPVVRATGGLSDSVVDARDDAAAATGIHFREASAAALEWAMRKALALHAIPQAVAHYRSNGMSRDFSWQTQAREYVRLYGEILHGP
jgi:starch synthase